MEKMFKQLKNSKMDGVEGVIKIDTGVAGPVVGVTICTHGNEVCGLQVADFILLNKNLLTKGIVYIVLNNIKATQMYFAAQTEEEQQNARFIDLNMNRLPSDLLSYDDSCNIYEIKRAKELMPIWKKFDYAIDIHSTPQKTPAFIVEGSQPVDKISKNFPVDFILRNMLFIQKGVPAIGFYGHKGVLSFGIEAGSHNDPKTIALTQDTIKDFFSKIGMLNIESKNSNKKFKIYNVERSIFIPNDSYEFTKDFPMFEPIKKGDVIAKGNGEDIVSPISGFVILAPKNLKHYNSKEESMFIVNEIG